MDLAHKIKPFSLRGLLSLPFLGYAKLFKHRGLYHNLLLGSLTRVAWLGGIFLLVAYLFHASFLKTRLFSFYFTNYKKDIFYGLLGIFTADGCHILLDKCFKTKK